MAPGEFLTVCTIALCHRVRRDVPLLVAANRDEFYARAAEPPRVLAADPWLAGPRDQLASGTWLAINRHGVLIGLTNRPPRPLRGPPLPDPDGTSTEVRDANLRSRGEVIPLLLAGAASAWEVAALASELPRGSWNPFYLLIADTHEALSLHYDGALREMVFLGPGVHILENRPVDDPTSAKVARLHEAIAPVSTWPADDVPRRLAELMGDHAVPDGGQDHRPAPLQAVCVHTPVYGTRSSAVIGLGRERRFWWHAEGPPCQQPFVDCSSLLASVASG